MRILVVSFMVIFIFFSICFLLISRFKIRQQLLGPNPFLIDRMLAIFYSLIEQEMLENFSNEIPMQVRKLRRHILAKRKP